MTLEGNIQMVYARSSNYYLLSYKKCILKNYINKNYDIREPCRKHYYVIILKVLIFVS